MEYWSVKNNLGDTLTPVICQWMLDRNGIKPDKKINGTKHLLTLGSVLGQGGQFDATVWGSGIHTFDSCVVVARRSKYRKFDIRSVRGPITRKALLAAQYDCPAVYGDPAILMPLMFSPDNVEKRYDFSVVLHYLQQNQVCGSCHQINVLTSDYHYFINEICASRKIISSSLHGIILAESYGVPAIFLCEGMENEMMKFYDWYYSTGRMSVKVASSIQEALEMEPMPLPDLSDLRDQIMNAFPYDLWD
ncbi:MAG: polysaccharide pyruvyl transferase family protein [Bacteroides thetaiotaomicron]|nr:polysaccharide pyruvyl transferase family protein [Bacteroides thetaiotaomicron]